MMNRNLRTPFRFANTGAVMNPVMPGAFIVAPTTPPAATVCPPPVSAALASFTPTSAWKSNLFTPAQLTGTGQVVPMQTDTWSMLASGLGLAGTALGAYHGYKRTGSLGWTLGWALLGGLFPIITIPVAFAQGFGRPEPSFRRSS